VTLLRLLSADSEERWWQVKPGNPPRPRVLPSRQHPAKNSLSWRWNVCTEQRHRTSLTSSSGLRTSRLEVVFAQRHHHHWLCVVHGCRLSATELFRSPLPPTPSSCLERTTALHLDCPCEFSAVVSRLIFHVFLCRLSVVPVKWLVSLEGRHFNRFC